MFTQCHGARIEDSQSDVLLDGFGPEVRLGLVMHQYDGGVKQKKDDIVQRENSAFFVMFFWRICNCAKRRSASLVFFLSGG